MHLPLVGLPQALIWSEAERDRFLTYARSRNPEVYEVIAFGVFTGLRRGEVQGLLRDSLDFDARMITVRRNFCDQTNTLHEHTKSNRIRQVPMNPVIFDILKSRRLLAPNQPVFTIPLHNFA